MPYIEMKSCLMKWRYISRESRRRENVFERFSSSTVNLPQWWQSICYVRHLFVGSRFVPQRQNWTVLTGRRSGDGDAHAMCLKWQLQERSRKGRVRLVEYRNAYHEADHLQQVRCFPWSWSVDGKNTLFLFLFAQWKRCLVLKCMSSPPRIVPVVLVAEPWHVPDSRWTFSRFLRLCISRRSMTFRCPSQSLNPV